MWNIYGRAGARDRTRRFPFNHDSKKIVFIKAALPGPFTHTIGGLVHFPSGWHCFLHFVFNTDAHTHTHCKSACYSCIPTSRCVHACSGWKGWQWQIVLVGLIWQFCTQCAPVRFWPVLFDDWLQKNGLGKHSVCGSTYVLKAFLDV